MKLLCFDVGGTLIKSAVLNEELELSRQDSVPTPFTDFESFVSVITDRYQECKEEVEGIAISMPGIIDAKKGIYYSGGVFRYPHPRNIAEVLSERCGCPVRIENDAKAAVLAEFHEGVLQGCQNACVFVIGTGVGGGLIIDSKVVRGPHFSAGEFSFVNTENEKYDDIDYMVGHRCSTDFLLRRYKELKGRKEEIDGRAFFARLESDDAARQAFDELCTNVALQIYNLHWLLDLEKVAIGGGISRQPILTERIREKFAEVKEKSFAGQVGFEMPVEIVTCRFCNDANLIGAFISYRDQRG